MPRYKTLLSFDLDGTILGDSAREARFREWASGRSKRIALAYASGRSMRSMREEIIRGRLPRPDALIGHLGTHIEFFFEGPAQEIETALFASVPSGWDVRLALRVGEGPGVRRQEDEHLNLYKASFYWDGSPDSLMAFKRRVAEGLMPGSWRLMEVDGMYLDLMPSTIGKAAATLALALHYGLTAESVIVAGDSENDQDMFTEPGFRRILPSNAVALLGSLAPDAYRSPYPEADGVLDGLARLGLA